ncbi:hypothetical protein ACET3Z_019829 [Daucus carota]
MDLYANEKREVSEDSINRIPFKVPNVPQQQDGIRCGYYVLYYIYRFLTCCPDEFNISEHYPGFLKKDWFSRNEIDSFCENLLSLVSETESSAASESGSVQIIDDLHTGMEVGYPVKVDDGDDNETEIDKDDDEKQEQKDTGNGLEKNNENKSPKARNTDRSESHAADDEGYRKTHKKCDAPVAPKKKSSKNFGRKGSDQKTVQKSQRVWNTSPSSDSDTLEPPLKRCLGKDCGNKGKKDVNASSDTNGPLLDESTKSSAASDSGVQIIDDLHTGMEVGYPVKVDNGDNNGTEIDKDDDEKQEQKDTRNGLEKDDENKSPKAGPVARNTDRSESPAADDEGYRKTHKKCDATLLLGIKNLQRISAEREVIRKLSKNHNVSGTHLPRQILIHLNLL